MKYTTKGKQDLDGIQTLIGNPLAIYNVVGDKKIRCRKKK